MNTERVAMVTGAGTGIGRAAATALVEAGWNVVFVGRRAEKLAESISLTGSPDRGVAIPADVSDPNDVDRLFASVEERFGRLDLLFNNAGLGAPAKPIDEIPVENWLQVLGVNLSGTFLCSRAAFGLMRRQNPRGGRIINNGSISAHAPRPGTAPYTATKHAITGLTKSIALDGRPFDIACGQIDIGNALTEMALPMSKGIQQPNGEIAVEATMDVNEVGSAIVYMAGLPLDANVLFMTLMATKMPFVGRG